MATPIGHSLIGIAIARRLGVRSPLGLAAAVVAANLPDADVFISYVRHRDPWKAHRTFSHTPGFALLAGLLLGASGVLRTHKQGPRDVVADAMTGAALVGSHVLLDRVRLPYPPLTRRHGPSPGAYGLDALVYGTLAFGLIATAAEE